MVERHGWPPSRDELLELQLGLAREVPPPWRPEPGLQAAGCFVCSARGKVGAGSAGEPAWAAAATETAVAVVTGVTGAPYEAGLLALREGPLLEAAVRALPDRPDVLLVDATGRDHPRRFGLALHLGAVLDLPTIGVTHRTLLAQGDWPPNERGATTPLVLDSETVAAWVRTRAGTRPLAIHAGWRVDVATAVEVVLAAAVERRTPEPLRRARTAAREARAAGARRSA